MVAVAGTGSYLPSTVLDNAALFEMGTIREDFDLDRARSSLNDVEGVDGLEPAEVFDLWARQVTGISERRVLAPERTGLTTEDMCAEAARRALEAAGLEAADLDLLFVASLTGADSVPNVACTVAEKIGAPTLGGYVLNAACAGYVYALGAGWSAIVSGMANRVLVVSGDALTRLVDYDDVKTAVVFADGAGAAVLTRSDGNRGILGPPSMSGEFSRDPLFLVGQGWETEEEPAPKLHMDGGPRILRNAIVKMAAIAEQAIDRAGIGWDDVDVVIPHQANLRITKGLEKHLDLATGRVIHNIQRYGNMSASTVAVTLDEVVRGKHGSLPDPATIVLTAIGGGYTMGAMVLRI
jgi:3-oxoacyl-[acyl-carrier-protein] synthase-3